MFHLDAKPVGGYKSAPSTGEGRIKLIMRGLIIRSMLEYVRDSSLESCNIAEDDMIAGLMESIARTVCEVHGHQIESFVDGKGGYLFFCTACGMPLDAIREKYQPVEGKVASAHSS